ncbi:jg9919 [Pararge aegeria aegeria]|uniref:Jg9919 protein n=1 Tax=Pararge aegeria aegeria TaxID=348720 RepID=A0A8S4RD84_9NEOP|nr:jg9919 [Pararge aegeria aegeria]
MEDSTVFLGMTLDCKLQWGTHIDTLAGKLSSAAYAVRKIRQISDVETARLVYFAYFHSVMSYGILLWGKAADIETIFILQKRAVRSIYKLKSRESLREKFKEIGIIDSPLCIACMEADETPTHGLLRCRGVAEQHTAYLGFLASLPEALGDLGGLLLE